MPPTIKLSAAQQKALLLLAEEEQQFADGIGKQGEGNSLTLRTHRGAFIYSNEAYRVRGKYPERIAWSTLQALYKHKLLTAYRKYVESRGYAYAAHVRYVGSGASLCVLSDLAWEWLREFDPDLYPCRPADGVEVAQVEAWVHIQHDTTGRLYRVCGHTWTHETGAGVYEVLGMPFVDDKLTKYRITADQMQSDYTVLTSQEVRDLIPTHEE